jgi:hypothetical protein
LLLSLIPLVHERDLFAVSDSNEITTPKKERSTPHAPKKFRISRFQYKIRRAIGVVVPDVSKSRRAIPTLSV